MADAPLCTTCRHFQPDPQLGASAARCGGLPPHQDLVTGDYRRWFCEVERTVDTGCGPAGKKHEPLRRPAEAA